MFLLITFYVNARTGAVVTKQVPINTNLSQKVSAYFFERTEANDDHHDCDLLSFFRNKPISKWFLLTWSLIRDLYCDNKCC